MDAKIAASRDDGNENFDGRNPNTAATTPNTGAKMDPALAMANFESAWNDEGYGLQQKVQPLRSLSLQGPNLDDVKDPATVTHPQEPIDVMEPKTARAMTMDVMTGNLFY